MYYMQLNKKLSFEKNSTLNIILMHHAHVLSAEQVHRRKSAIVPEPQHHAA